MVHAVALIVPLSVEVIASSVADALAAEAGGAARVELVSDLARGGLTPALNVLEDVIARVRIPVRVMLRASEPHILTDPAERAHLVQMAGEIAGRRPDGLVFGALHDGGIDEDLLEAVTAAAPGLAVTFHRAFEDLHDWHAGIRVLKGHPAVDRILVDGGSGTWMERSRRLAALARAAAPAIRILAGGGVTHDALDILARTPGLTEVHVGRLVRKPPTAEGAVSAERVASVVNRLARASP